MPGYSQIICCLQEESTNFELNQVFVCPKMCRYPPNCILLIALKAFLTLPNFISRNWFYSFFLIIWKHQAILLDAKLKALILCLYLFYMLCVLFIHLVMHYLKIVGDKIYDYLL